MPGGNLFQERFTIPYAHIHVQYSDIMRFIVHHNRHHKVSQSVPFFICPRIVAILLRIKVRGTPRDAYTVRQESNYEGVLDNPLRPRVERKEHENKRILRAT